MEGEPKQFNVKIEASQGSLTNIWLEFQGIPDEWYVTEPVNISILASGDSAIFTVQITVPKGETGDRQIIIVANSSEDSDEQDMLLRIFTSKKDLINFELARLRAKLEELRDRAEKAKETGFETKEIEDLLDDAEGEIKLAEGYLREELYDSALESIYTAWKYLEEAEDLLNKMVVGFAIPWFVFLFIGIAVVIAILVFVLRRLYKNFKLLVRGRLSEARQAATTIRAGSLQVEKLREEKSKTSRMLALLETQFRQGIISKEAYASLKTRSEQRLADLDKQIREAIRS
jgi:hypothetical protein